MSGHGWVTPNENGSRARCGGPGFCKECAVEYVRYHQKMQAEHPDGTAASGDALVDYKRAVQSLNDAERALGVAMEKQEAATKEQGEAQYNRDCAARALKEARQRLDAFLLTSEPRK